MKKILLMSLLVFSLAACDVGATKLKQNKVLHIYYGTQHDYYKQNEYDCYVDNSSARGTYQAKISYSFSSTNRNVYIYVKGENVNYTFHYYDINSWCIV